MEDSDHHQRERDRIRRNIFETQERLSATKTDSDLDSDADEFEPIVTKRTKRNKRRRTNNTESDSDREPVTYRQHARPTRIQNKQKFIAVISGEKPYSKLTLGDIAVSKFLYNTLQNRTVKSVRRTKQGEVAVELHSETQLATLLQQTHIGPKQICVRVPRNMLKSQGVIRNIDLEEDMEELLGVINSDNKSIHAESCKRLHTKNKLPSNAVMVSFDGPHLPTHIYVGFIKHRVDKYIRPPIRCTHCQAYNHTADRCNAKLKCPRCGGEHTFENCSVPDAEKKCPNCGGSHSAGYKGCVAHKQEAQIIRTQTTNNISYANAVRQVKTQQHKRPIPSPRYSLLRKEAVPETPVKSRRRPIPTPRKHKQTPRKHKPTYSQATQGKNTRTRTPTTTNKTTVNTSNNTITLDIMDFLNFFREATRMVALGALNREPSETIRERLTIVSNTCLGTKLQPGDLHKHYTNALDKNSEGWAKLNAMMSAILHPTDKTNKTSKHHNKQQHTQPEVPSTSAEQTIRL